MQILWLGNQRKLSWVEGWCKSFLFLFWERGVPQFQKSELNNLLVSWNMNNPVLFYLLCFSFPLYLLLSFPSLFSPFPLPPCADPHNIYQASMMSLYLMMSYCLITVLGYCVCVKWIMLFFVVCDLCVGVHNFCKCYYMMDLSFLLDTVFHVTMF